MRLSVVIPAYNEAGNIVATLAELKQNIAQCKLVKDLEIIVIDDHSSDSTFDTVRSLKDKKTKCIRLSRRSGSHTALRAGLLHAAGDVVLAISADGQENPDVFNSMLLKIKEGKHVVWGVRRKREENVFSKFFAFIAYQLITMFIESDVSREVLSNTDFFLISRKVVDAVNQFKERNTSLFGLIIWLGFKQDFVVYDRRIRRNEESKWSFRSKVRAAVSWIVAFSGIPLKLISLLGIMTALLGFAYALFIIIYASLGYTPPGWAEPVILILVLGGVQMVMLGLMGEYLWRNLDETRNRPLYFVEDMTGEE